MFNNVKNIDELLKKASGEGDEDFIDVDETFVVSVVFKVQEKDEDSAMKRVIELVKHIPNIDKDGIELRKTGELE